MTTVSVTAQALQNLRSWSESWEEMPEKESLDRVVGKHKKDVTCWGRLFQGMPDFSYHRLFVP